MSGSKRLHRLSRVIESTARISSHAPRSGEASLQKANENSRVLSAVANMVISRLPGCGNTLMCVYGHGWPRGHAHSSRAALNLAAASCMCAVTRGAGHAHSGMTPPCSGTAKSGAATQEYDAKCKRGPACTAEALDLHRICPSGLSAWLHSRARAQSSKAAPCTGGAPSASCPCSTGRAG